MVALSHDLQAANTALKARVLAAAEQRGAWDEELRSVAFKLQEIAMSLLNLCRKVTDGDADLSYRVLAAAVVVMDGGSLANNLWHCSNASKNLHVPFLAGVVHDLNHMSTLSEAHKRSLAVLRATAFRPEAILASLRRLLLGMDPPGKGRDTAHCNVCNQRCT